MGFETEHVTFPDNAISLGSNSEVDHFEFLKTLHRTELDPEQSLALAILEDAINEMRNGGASYGYVKDKLGRRARNSSEALAWVKSDGNQDYCFSFVGICRIFGWAPSWMRRGILALPRYSPFTKKGPARRPRTRFIKIEDAKMRVREDWREKARLTAVST